MANPASCVLGWHDSHGASASLLSPEGRILFAASEERYTKKKLQKGYPRHAIADALARAAPASITRAYADLPPLAKVGRNLGLLWNSARKGLDTEKSLTSLAATAAARIRLGRFDAVSSLGDPTGQTIGFDRLCEHHTAHAASAYYLSGFPDALVVTIDGVGDCISAAVFEGADGVLTLRHKRYYNDFTVGADYEVVTALLGFNPDRHCGKITGLAAYGRYHPACVEALKNFLATSWRRGRCNYFDRMHSADGQAVLAELRHVRKTQLGAHSRENLAYAIQYLSEQRVLEFIRNAAGNPRDRNIALAGGVFANVRINQKIKQLGFRNIFVQPAMDDTGLSLGVALHALAQQTDLQPYRLENVFLGPSFTDEHLQEALDRADVSYERVDHLAFAVASLLADGNVVARFDGPMEFGPRALGNRSILYDARDPSVNQWLNQRLRRTEFMPFAPATAADHAEPFYVDLEGARHAAEFMTLTFDCTPRMRETSPAVVHVDGTARAQLVAAESNPGFYEILDEYRKITGIPTLVNTSFNMHEAPIVATPDDAIQSFRQSGLDYLAMGPFLAKADTSRNAAANERTTMNAELVPA